jgi:hypothetical protein
LDRTSQEEDAFALSAVSCGCAVTNVVAFLSYRPQAQELDHILVIFNDIPDFFWLCPNIFLILATIFGAD